MPLLKLKHYTTMKRKYFLQLFISILILTTCSTTPSTYTLEGTFIEKNHDLYEGKLVYLLDTDNMYSKRIDSCIVENNKFSFTEQIYSPYEIRFVEFKEHTPPSIFIKEQGDISIEIGDKGFVLVEGVQNKLYQAFKDSLSVKFKTLRNSLEELDNLNKNNVLSIDEFKRIDKERTLMYQSLETNILEYIKTLGNSKLAQHLIFNYTAYIKPSNLQVVLDSIFSNDVNDENYQMYREIIKGAILTDIGMKFIDIHGVNIHGDSLSLSSLIGKDKLTMVDFWASWCSPCRSSNPKLKEIYNENKSKGLGVVGITLDEDKDSWLKAVKDDKLEWDQIATFNANDIHSQYGISGIPTYLLIDKNGIIRKKDSGSNKLLMEMNIKLLLEEGTME